MLLSLLRSLKCRQVGQVLMSVSVNGTAGTPAASGPDAFFVSSVVDNGTGSWTINLKEASKLNLVPTGLVCLTADSSMRVSAVTTSSITVQARSVQDVPVAKDVDFIIQWQHSDQLNYYF